MFSTLGQGSQIYILKKDSMELCVGSVTEKTDSNPVTTLSYMNPNPNREIKLKVTANGDTYTFGELLASESKHDYGDVVIADSRKLILCAVESVVAGAEQRLGMREHDEDTVSKGKELMMQLNPALAKEQATERRLSALEKTMGNVEGMLTRLLEANGVAT